MIANMILYLFVRYLWIFSLLLFMRSAHCQSIDSLKPFSKEELEELSKTKERVRALKDAAKLDDVKLTPEQIQIVKAIHSYNQGRDTSKNIKYITDHLVSSQTDGFDYVIIKALKVDDQTFQIFSSSISKNSPDSISLAAINRFAAQVSMPKVEEFLIQVLNSDSISRSAEQRVAEILIGTKSPKPLRAVADYLVRTRRIDRFMNGFVEKYYPEIISELEILIDAEKIKQQMSSGLSHP